MTWSIVAHDPNSDAFAVAVATKAFAVGASCPFVRAGVGAVSTQSFTNRYLGPAILDALARGLPPDAAIESALAGDVGRGIRQVHAVDRHGRTAAWTGANCVTWCGSLAAPGISVAGNMLAGEPTVAATFAAWQSSPDLPVPERLMAAMEAGEAAGGDRRGRQSAAMKLATTEDFADLDLRVAGWTGRLGLDRPADASVSTTALHWLLPPDLAAMYAEVATVLRPGGLLLNGDHLAEDETSPVLVRLGRALIEREVRRRPAPDGGETWSSWWEAVAADPELGPLAARPERSGIGAGHHGSPSGRLAVHVAALQKAGFEEVGTLWQRGDNRLLCAVLPG